MPADGAAVVNFTLVRVNVGEMIRLSIPPSPGKISTSDTMVPSIQVTNPTRQLEDLLKKKVKQSPNLFCLYRYIFVIFEICHHIYRIFFKA